MHSLTDCPLRTFCCITTTDYAPFLILNIDSPALDLLLAASSSSSSSTTTPSVQQHSASSLLDPLSYEEAILAQRRSKALRFLRGRPIDDLLVVDHESCLVPTEQTSDSVQSYTLNAQLLQQLSFFNNNNINVNTGTDKSSNTHGGFIQKTRRTTRRIHGCIHSSASSSTSSSSCLSSHSPLSLSKPRTSASSKSSALLQELQLQDQIVPSWEESSQETEGSFAESLFQEDKEEDDEKEKEEEEESQVCRVYVLKDVTEMHSLALAARTDALRRERASASRDSAVSMSSVSILHSPRSYTHPYPHTTTATTATTTTCSSGSEANVTHKLYCPNETLDWSGSTRHSSHCNWPSSPSPSAASCTSTSSSSSCPDASSSSPSTDHQQQLSDPGLLLLHVTRFGTVDHAIAIPQQKQQQLSIQPSLLLDSAQDECIIKAMTNTSVMSYVHPDDIRALCQGLDRACKALYTVFRIRWRLGGQDHLLESDRLHHHHQQCPFDSASSTQEGSVRLIEFQGESFEEYVDPTAVPNSSLTFRVSNDGHTLAKYAWAEITGVLSNSQPLLVVRPLTAAELSDQSQEAALATAAAATAASNSSTIASSRRSNARGLDVQKKKGWKTKSKRMNLEEGMRMPKQLNLSALTSLSRHDETDLRMPVSPPLSMPVSQPLQQQPSQQLMTPTRCRNPSGHANPMPSFLAFPSNATLPWSGMFLTIALDAWKQWIQTVYAGQAQFQDWCEYLLETTIDQMIESVALGLTLLGFEEAPVLDQYRIEEGGDPTDSTIAASALQRKNKQIRYTDRDVTIETWADSHPVTSTATTTTTSVHYQQQQKAIKHQQTLSGLNRAGKILHSYPSIEGVVRNIGKTWLGRKIKSRLEQKLDVVADQVVDWWEAGEVHIAAWSPLMRSFSSSSGATVTELSVVDDLDLSSSSLSPVVVVVPATLVE